MVAPSLHVVHVRPDVYTSTTVSFVDAAVSRVVNGRELPVDVPMYVPRWNKSPWRGEFGLWLSIVTTTAERSAQASKLLWTGM